MYYQKTKEEIIKLFKTDEHLGLSNEYALELLKTNGENALKEAKQETILIKFIKQFKDPLTIVLIVAALISVVVDIHEWLESLVIMVVVLFNALLGTYQEHSAEKSLAALKKLSSPTSKVIRNGILQAIPSSQVVVGDLIIVEAGDFVPSDARIIENYNLRVDESSLTGESLPVEKTAEPILEDDIALGDRKNMIYASSICSFGRAKAIVVTTAMDNEIGKIAQMLQVENKSETPLQNKLKDVSKVISYMAFAICGLVFLLELINTNGNIISSFKIAIALAVAAVPEGLATVVTILLAIGVSKMAKQNAIVRKLPAVETLGSCSVICSDKTGTLTQNLMSVVKVFNLDQHIQEFNDVVNNVEFKEMLSLFTLCSDGQIEESETGFKFIGDPTETALVYASYKMGDIKADLTQKYPRVHEIAFDSDRKMMTVIVKYHQGYLSITKGACDQLCACLRDKSANTVILENNEKMANQALRVLALATKYYDTLPSDLSVENLEKDLEFKGMVAMIDPPRIEVKQAIAQAKQGGIKVVMITGDHFITAKAIAQELGIYSEGDIVLSGVELDNLSDDELLEKVTSISVYARVSPKHKVRIVEAFKKKNMVVAMTGDGVNDSPALKISDIGCAMGIVGSDVSKQASDMILTDDNFATIISAIKQGRGIYANIKRDVKYLLSCNIGEVFAIFVCSLLSVLGWNLGVPLAPIHLLFVNLVTDVMPAFAIGMEPTDDDIMKQPPLPKNASFFEGKLAFEVLRQGIMIGLITLVAYLLGNTHSHDHGVTMAFITLCVSQLVHSFNIKTEKSILSKRAFTNKYLWYATLAGFAMVVLISEIPILASIFSLVPIDITQFLICLGLSSITLWVVEIVKLLKRH